MCVCVCVCNMHNMTGYPAWDRCPESLMSALTPTDTGQPSRIVTLLGYYVCVCVERERERESARARVRERE
jgi:hypothetical protein